jgi:hypothetical protein
MKEDIKAKWLSALRRKNSKYKQTHAVLRDFSGYCCLGVLCDLYAKETGAKWEERSDLDAFDMLDNGWVLPVEVQKWAGLLSRSGGEVIVDGKSVTLSEVNDDLKLSFLQIADIIEEQL